MQRSTAFALDYTEKKILKYTFLNLFYSKE